LQSLGYPLHRHRRLRQDAPPPRNSCAGLSNICAGKQGISPMLSSSCIANQQLALLARQLLLVCRRQKKFGTRLSVCERLT
jgi:hypothetical protein